MRAFWLLLIASAASADVGADWSLAPRFGGGGATSGSPRGFELALRLDALVGKGDGTHELAGGWAAGPFADLRTLDFARTDLSAGLSLLTPGTKRHDFHGLLQVGGGFGFGNHPHPDAPQALVSLFGGWRLPMLRHQAGVFGLYVDTRILSDDVEITAGVVLDPVGAVMLLATRAMSF
jgi:hypothetical protein